jgi:phosphoserine phosphatase
VPLLAERTEANRNRWVTERMVDGRPRPRRQPRLARRLRLHEGPRRAALTEERGDVPVSIVRPSIIESSPRRAPAGMDPRVPHGRAGHHQLRPRPAEGVPRRARGRGRRHPRRLVVAATIAVAARGPVNADGSPDVIQVASGGVNPLRYRRLVNLVHGWFTEHPVYDREGQPIVVPEWTFPGRGRVQGQLDRATKAFDLAEKALRALPLRGKQADLSARSRRREPTSTGPKLYVELYGAYVECEAVYGVDTLLALFESLPTPIKRRSASTRGSSTGTTTRPRSTCPRSSSTPACDDGGPGREGREHRLRRQVLDAERHVAAFDLENTLIASNVVASYAWLATRRLPWDDRVRFVLKTLAEAPGLLAMDRKDRGDFLRHFYRRYEGAPSAAARRRRRARVRPPADEGVPAGPASVREHRALGHRHVLITGALDIVIDPIRPLFDDVVCASMWSGPTGRGRRADRRAAHRRVARPGALRLLRGQRLRPRGVGGLCRLDSDLPLLEAAGYPVAVNPETKLAAIARSRGLARRALGQGRRRPPQAPPHRTVAAEDPPASGVVKALLFERKVARYAAAAIAGASRRARSTGRAARLADVDPPELPGAAWVRVRPRLAGICGSDLATIDGHSSRYFEPIVSLPVRALVTRWWATPTTAAASPRPDPHLRRAGIEPMCDQCRSTGRTCASESPSATSSQGSRPASANRPAADGRRSSSPTRASSSTSPTTSPTSRPSWSSRPPAAVHAARRVDSGRPPSSAAARSGC